MIKGEVIEGNPESGQGRLPFHTFCFEVVEHSNGFDSGCRMHLQMAASFEVVIVDEFSGVEFVCDGSKSGTLKIAVILSDAPLIKRSLKIIPAKVLRGIS